MAIETATIKAGLAIAGAAVSAAGAVSQGRAANQAAKFRAAQLQQQADRDRQLAAQQANDQRDAAARQQASLRARVAGSGTTLEGTPLAILSDIAGESEFQSLRIAASGETAANRALGEAALTRFEGRNARRAGFIRAGSSLLTSASKGLQAATPSPTGKKAPVLRDANTGRPFIVDDGKTPFT